MHHATFLLKCPQQCKNILVLKLVNQIQRKFEMIRKNGGWTEQRGRKVLKRHKGCCCEAPRLCSQHLTPPTSKTCVLCIGNNPTLNHLYLCMQEIFTSSKCANLSHCKNSMGLRNGKSANSSCIVKSNAEIPAQFYSCERKVIYTFHLPVVFHHILTNRKFVHN